MKPIRFLPIFLFLLQTGIYPGDVSPPRARARDIGIEVGCFPPGSRNAITDVSGVMVGHCTLNLGEHVRTGVTVVIPHSGNVFQEKVPAAIYCFNAFGKLAGYTQVEELGNIETPVALTNTLSVGVAVTALVKYTLQLPGNEEVRSVNAVVGETNDGFLNDIRGMHVRETDVLKAIKSAEPGPVEEGSVGAGTGTVAFGFKGGVGTSSRIVPEINGTEYTVGVLVQSNFGRMLTVNGVPFGREIRQESEGTSQNTRGAGSCMIVIATDAPLSPRNLKRLAKRAFAGMARTESVMPNGSGDYAIAFSTAYRIPYRSEGENIKVPALIGNDDMTVLFQAVEEATQEAIYNSLFMATRVRGFQGHTAEAISLDDLLRIMSKFNRLRKKT